MSTSNVDVEGATPVLEPWQAGAVGGLLGALLWGIYATFRTPALLETYLPETLGLGAEQYAMGWIVLLALGAVLAVVYVLVVENTALDDYLTDNVTNGQGGIAFGIVSWAIVTALLVPVLAGAVGSQDLAVPLVEIEHLVGHVVYGVVVGVTYSVLVD